MMYNNRIVKREGLNIFVCTFSSPIYPFHNIQLIERKLLTAVM